MSSYTAADLRLLRQEFGIKQSEIAKAAGLTQSYVARIESGDRTNPESLARMIEALHRIVTQRREAEARWQAGAVFLELVEQKATVQV